MELFYDLVSKFELIKQFGVLTKTVKDNVRCEDIIRDLGRLDEKFPLRHNPTEEGPHQRELRH